MYHPLNNSNGRILKFISLCLALFEPAVEGCSEYWTVMTYYLSMHVERFRAEVISGTDCDYVFEVPGYYQLRYLRCSE